MAVLFWLWPGDRPLPLSRPLTARDRKSTRLNSSHLVISYAVFCLKKKNRPLLRVRKSPISSVAIPRAATHARTQTIVVAVVVVVTLLTAIVTGLALSL